MNENLLHCYTKMFIMQIIYILNSVAKAILLHAATRCYTLSGSSLLLPRCLMPLLERMLGTQQRFIRVKSLARGASRGCRHWWLSVRSWR